jgi:hypothetical protein
MIGNLLDDDRSTALTQIENAWNRAINNVKELSSDVVPMGEEARTLHLAVGLMGKRFRPLKAANRPLDLMADDYA